MRNYKRKNSARESTATCLFHSAKTEFPSVELAPNVCPTRDFPKESLKSEV
jgi:hypothetical protein